MNYASTLNPPLQIGAFLLAGGASSRMGRDKALIPVKGIPLLIRLAKVLSTIGSEFHILAPQGRYESFGYPILNDIHANSGPLAGIEVALETSAFDWNLILACDLPFIEADWLLQLAAVALNSSNLQCVASATSPDSPNPLCALWHKSALPKVRSALDSQNFRVRSVVEVLQTQILIPPDPGILANWNRPQDISALPGE